MFSYGNLGAEFLKTEVAQMTTEIQRQGIVEFNEKNRYLPEGVGPRVGYIRYDLTPFMIEILECFEPESPVREVNVLKGVQTGFTTLLESVLFYYIGYIKSQPGMFITADKELATNRVDNNIIPMLNESGLGDLIRSSDTGNSRKTGKTKDYLQWQGGGYMYFNGAVNANKMRSASVPLLLKDEIDGWKRGVGNDGNPDLLTNDRASAFWDMRKICRGSTPLTYPSLAHESFERGDQRRYHVMCQACSFPQYLKLERVDKETGTVSGFLWEVENGLLVKESVRYACQSCGHEHYEHDKAKLFSLDHGAHWLPTAKDYDPEIRSYHLPAFYAPAGITPWYKHIESYLNAYNPATKKVKNVKSFQVFYNNVLGMPFKVQGAKIQKSAVNAHRREQYKYGQVPNEYAARVTPSKILFLTCQVDVHKKNLAVTVMGWTNGARCFVVDYWRYEPQPDEQYDCTDGECTVWRKLAALIEDRRYIADDGTEYGVLLTLVDAGYVNETVTTFCQQWASGVYPILGRKTAARNQTIKEFAEFPTKLGTTGYRITVDHYKDRNASSLRRQWQEMDGEQPPYHFNLPVDATGPQIDELTAEQKVEIENADGSTSFAWDRPSGKDNELWDLLQYGSAAVEIWAYNLCMQQLKLEKVEWGKVWEFCADPRSDKALNRVTHA